MISHKLGEDTCKHTTKNIRVYEKNKSLRKGQMNYRKMAERYEQTFQEEETNKHVKKYSATLVIKEKHI